MDTTAIHVFAKWQVKEGHLDTILGLLPDLAKQSAAEKGNLFYMVHRHHSDPNTLLLFEGYRDEAAMTEHRNSQHFQSIVVGKIIPLLASREVSLATPLPI